MCPLCWPLLCLHSPYIPLTHLDWVEMIHPPLLRCQTSSKLSLGPLWHVKQKVEHPLSVLIIALLFWWHSLHALFQQHSDSNSQTQHGLQPTWPILPMKLCERNLRSQRPLVFISQVTLVSSSTRFSLSCHRVKCHLPEGKIIQLQPRQMQSYKNLIERRCYVLLSLLLW